MKLLTKNTDYAARALLHLAGNEGEFISSRQIAVQEKIPLPYLRRILLKLRQEGIISAKEGVNGGVKLRRSPDHIHIGRLIEIFQGRATLLDCVFRKDICFNLKSCPLRKRIKGIEKKVAAELKQVTIKNLFDDIEQGDGK